MPCRADFAVYFQRVPYLRGDFRYGFFIFIGNTVIHSCVKVEPSYEIKNAPRGCAVRGKENIALRTAPARRIPQAGFFFSRRKYGDKNCTYRYHCGEHRVRGAAQSSAARIRQAISSAEWESLTGEKNVHIISVAIDAPQDVINALSGKIGRLAGITAKTVYSNV